MMKRIQHIIMALMLILGMGHSWAISGDGSQSTPYQISSASDWDTFRTAVSNASSKIYAELTADITIPSGAYTPVGTSNNPFYGNFYGNGHTITLENAQGSSDNFGLFGYVYLSSIYNLKVAGTMTVSGSHSHIGGIVGYIKGSQTDGATSDIMGCTFSGTLDAGSSADCIGGIVGYVEPYFKGQIKYCFFEGTLKTTSTSTNRYIGGILGYFKNLHNRYHYIGKNFCDAEFKNGTSDMSSGTFINGIIGQISTDASGVLENTYISHGNISGACGPSDNANIASSNKAITISVTAGSNGSVSRSYVLPTSAQETRLRVEATPNTGYRFVEWTNNSTSISTDNPYSAALTDNVSLQATLIAQHTITLQKYNNYDYRCKLYVDGTESTGGTYDHGTQLTLKCVPDTYCHFSRWENGSSTVSNTAEFTYTVDGDATLTARCDKNEYTLTLQTNIANSGTVSGSRTGSGPNWGSNPAEGSCDA